MYIGRFLVVGKTEQGKPFVSYRVSSRSFPNRKAVINNTNDTVAILPNDLNDMFANPYIAYNCIKIVGNTVIATNGTHTDIIADKIKLELPIRDALSLSLIAMDYEKDDYNTPRIAVVLNENTAYMGYVADNDIRIKEVPLKNGLAYYLGVYDACKISINHHNIAVEGENSAEEICKFIMEYEEFEKPVCCATAIIDKDIKIGTL